MSDQEIFEKLGLQNASDELKQSTMQTLVETVDLRTMSAINEMLDDEQMQQLESMESGGASKEEMFGWLSSQGIDSGEIYQSTLAEYIEELVDDMARFEL